MLSRSKDNKNVDKNADLNDRELYILQSQDYKLGVRLKSVPHGKIFTFKRLN